MENLGARSRVLRLFRLQPPLDCRLGVSVLCVITGFFGFTKEYEGSANRTNRQTSVADNLFDSPCRLGRSRLGLCCDDGIIRVVEISIDCDLPTRLVQRRIGGRATAAVLLNDFLSPYTLDFVRRENWRSRKAVVRLSPPHCAGKKFCWTAFRGLSCCDDESPLPFPFCVGSVSHPSGADGNGIL